MSQLDLGCLDYMYFIVVQTLATDSLPRDHVDDTFCPWWVGFKEVCFHDVFKSQYKLCVLVLYLVQFSHFYSFYRPQTGQHPLRSTSGQYASYWNAFLFGNGFNIYCENGWGQQKQKKANPQQKTQQFRCKKWPIDYKNSISA